MSPALYAEATKRAQQRRVPPPPERMVTRGVSGAIRHKSVGEILNGLDVRLFSIIFLSLFLLTLSSLNEAAQRRLPQRETRREATVCPARALPASWTTRRSQVLSAPNLQRRQIARLV